MTDNSLGNARNLGALSNKAVARRDLVGPRDRTDFYKFTLNRSSNATFQLSGLKANADLIMLNGAGKAIARSRKGGNQAEQVNRQLAAGTYYIQVVGRGSKQTRYKLTGSTSDDGGTGPGTGTADNPIDLGTLTNAPVSRSQDSAGFGDEKELYYKFQMGQIGAVNFRMSQVTGSGAVGLYYDSNRNGKWDFEDQTVSFTVAEGSVSNNTSDSEILPAAGTYFLKARSGSLTSNVRYDLLLTPTLFPGNLPSDPGPEETTAYNLGTLNKGSSFDVKDYIGRVDEKDVFRFNLGTAAKLAYTKAVPSGDEFSVYAKIVYDTNGNGLSDSSDQVIFNSNTDDELFDLQAGNYFMFVERGPGAYSINLSAS